ncbi:hypothetical protein B0H14DRAFT_2606405 [Mycena olivaceomarginata]|nr:hypothetical protein B0H14DRAFT_2606405 [Mycena olivaceomarginata]
MSLGAAAPPFVAENEEEHDLETSLFNTIYSIIDKFPGRYGDEYYDDSDDSKYLKINDFIAFVLVPFVAVALIVEDYAPRLDFQDALFERNNSIEFGELQHPEDDADVAAHEVHHQNVLGLRSTKLIPPLPLHKDAAAAPPPLPLRKYADAAPPPSPVQGAAPPRHYPRPQPMFKPDSSPRRQDHTGGGVEVRRFCSLRCQKKPKSAGKAVSGAEKTEKAEGREKKEKKTKKPLLV